MKTLNKLYYGFNRSYYEWNFCDGENESQLVKKSQEIGPQRKNPQILNAEKQASKTNKPVCTEYGIVNPLILKLSIKKGV